MKDLSESCRKSGKGKYRVLVTAIGSFSAEHVITRLKKSSCFVAACDIYPEKWVANSRLADCFRQAPYCTDEEKYIKFLLDYCKDLDIHYIVPLIDPEVDLLSRLSDDFALKGITVCTPSAVSTANMRNKLTFGETASAAAEGFGCVRTIHTVSFAKAPDDFPLPAVIKPAAGRSSIGKKVIESREEFLSLRNLPEYSDHIIQPFTEGKIITVDAIRDTFGNTAFSSRRELLRTLSGAGTTVETIPDCPVEPYCASLLEKFGAVGCVNIEFIENILPDGSAVYYVLEINPRFSGGIEFSHMAGCDFVNEYFKIFCGLACGKPYAISQKKAPCGEKIIARSYKAYEM